MLNPLSRMKALAIASITCLLLTTLSHQTFAQTGPQLYIVPFAENANFETTDGMFSIFQNNTNNNNELDLFYIWSESRAKLDAIDLPQMRVGYEVRSLVTNSTSPIIPSALNNINVGFSYDFGEIFDNWELAGTAGAGTANDGNFGNGTSYYGMGTVILSYIFNPQQKIAVGVSFDGNRDIFPDTPLPFIQYYHFVSPEFQYSLGFYNTLNWKPIDYFQINAGGGIFLGGQVIGAEVRASYFPVDGVELFLNFDNTTEGYYQEGQGLTRIFYMYNIAGGGISVDLAENLNIAVGGGYAFNQRFATGFDFRDLSTIERPEDSPALFINIEASF